MLPQNAGVIVNVSSIATRGLNRVPYAAAKGGVNAITASLAWEVAQRGIRVVVTAPEGIEAPRGSFPATPTLNKNSAKIVTKPSWVKRSNHP